MLSVRSPAPPVIALVGLLGMLVVAYPSAGETHCGLEAVDGELAAAAVRTSRLWESAGRGV